MKEKGILKFKGTQSKGAMHYITYNGKTVTLTLKSSRKILDIRKSNKLLIADSLLSRNFKEIQVKTIEDIQVVKEVFELMKTKRHTHYKDWDEELVVLQYN